MAKKPNILFIFSDQHRHDVLGCAGHSLVQTPNLDRLADWGMRFERTWTQCPVCMPCRATMITGRYTHELGFTSNATADRGDTVDDSPFKPAWPTIASCPVLLPITRWIGCNRAIPRSPFIFTWVLCNRMFR